MGLIGKRLKLDDPWDRLDLKANSSQTVETIKIIIEGSYRLTDALGVAIVSHIPYSSQVAALFKRPFLRFTEIGVRRPVDMVHSFFIHQTCWGLRGANVQWRHVVVNLPATRRFSVVCQQRDTVERRWAFAKHARMHDYMYQYIRAPRLDSGAGSCSEIQTSSL